MTKPIQFKNLIIGSGIPKICVPITACSKEEICAQAVRVADAGADLVEWRADFFENLDNPEKTAEVLDAVSDILGQIPLLFTIRTAKEGGSKEMSAEEYARCCLNAAKTGKADMVDVEVFGEKEKKKELIQKLHEASVKVIASSHDFVKTDDKDVLLNRFKAMNETGADILKMAVMPSDFTDVTAIMEATCEMQKYTDRPLVSMSMGKTGVISRVAGESFGSCITFGAVGQVSAPGQLPVKELRMMLESLHG